MLSVHILFRLRTLVALIRCEDCFPCRSCGWSEHICAIAVAVVVIVDKGPCFRGVIKTLENKKSETSILALWY